MASAPVLPRLDARPPAGVATPPRALRIGHRKNHRGRIATIIAFALVLTLRLLPGSTFLALDRGGGGAADPLAVIVTPANPSEMAAQTFPGSAYFFAQDAFAVETAPSGVPSDPAVTAIQHYAHSAHVFQIDTGPAALSMPMRGLTVLDRARALHCMTNALYYEAGNEPEEGQRAVGQVILNRLASGLWPNSICGVVYQGTERSDRRCQFTFSCDGSMARRPAPAAWLRARTVAARLLSGEVFAPAGLATFYHTLAVRPPWAERVRPVAVVGAHIFYRLPGGAGAPAAYRMRYSGRENAQPGPFAFVPPPSPASMLAPPGPNDIGVWTPAPATLEPMAPASTPAASVTQAALPQPVWRPVPTLAPPTAIAPPGYGRAQGSPGLPQSTVRPEFRSSGRPLP